MFTSLPGVPANVVSGSDASASWVERLHDERCEPISWRYAAEHVSGVPWPQEQEAEEGAEVPAAAGQSRGSARGHAIRGSPGCRLPAWAAVLGIPRAGGAGGSARWAAGAPGVVRSVNRENASPAGPGHRRDRPARTRAGGRRADRRRGVLGAERGEEGPVVRVVVRGARPGRGGSCQGGGGRRGRRLAGAVAAAARSGGDRLARLAVGGLAGGKGCRPRAHAAAVLRGAGLARAVPGGVGHRRDL